eukprot:3457255-Amphidinium_carterae.1
MLAELCQDHVAAVAQAYLQIDPWNCCGGNLAIRGESGFALSSDETAQVETRSLEHNTKVMDDPSAWSASTIASIIKHCPAGKAKGAWGNLRCFLLLPLLTSAAPQDCGTCWGLACRS